MPKYKLKEVNAIQCLTTVEGMDAVAKFTRLPVKLTVKESNDGFWKGYDYLTITYKFDDGEEYEGKVFHGDYIIESLPGMYEVQGKEVFENRYERTD